MDLSFFKISKNKFTSIHLLITILILISIISFSYEKEDKELQNNKKKTTVLIKYDLTSDSEIIVPEEHDITDKEIPINSSESTPLAKLKKKDHTFSGWTADGIHGYEPGDPFLVKEKDLVFKPLFINNKSNKYYYADYKAFIDGKEIDISDEVSSGIYKENQIVMVSPQKIDKPNASSMGWILDGGEVFIYREKFVMPGRDVVLTPDWHDWYRMFYYTGDVEGVNGSKMEAYIQCEGTARELPEVERFSRNGYKIIGWYSTYDNEIFLPYYSYKMPARDVEFYAVWEPIVYAVMFKQNGNKDLIRIRGNTDTVIKVPDIKIKKDGYTFGGWICKDIDDKVYLPGDDFRIVGQIPGKGIGLDPIWIKNDE